jgi:DNA-binding MarR family transcriptional regulator
MVEEFVTAIGNMADCYRPQVIALIEQELSHTPYMTRQAAMRLRQDIAAIGRVSLGEYVELLSDADFLDILRGRGEFVQTAAEKLEAEQEAAAQARLARDRSEKEKGGLLNRLLSSDDAPRNVVALTPKFGSRKEAASKTPHDEMADGRNKISRQAQRRVAHFILASLFDTLVERGRMRAEVARAMRQSVRQRIEKAKFESRIVSRTAPVPVEHEFDDVMHDDAGEQGRPVEPVTIDHYILDALSRNEDALVVQSLAHYAQMPAAIVSKILDSGSARAITALAWRAGMSAPSAVVLQMSAAIPEDSIERPAAGGRYAMASTDMDWYIDFFNELQPSGPRGRAAGTTAAASPHGSEKSGRTRRLPDERPQGPKGE